MTWPPPAADHTDSTARAEQELRRALARTAHRTQPSAAPVDHILRCGRARRTRRTVLASAAAVMAVGLAGSLFLHGSEADKIRPQHRAPASPSAAPRTALVGQGRLGGSPWSVTLEYYPTWPKGFTPPTYPERLHIPAPTGHGLLCTQSVIDGVPWQRATDPWADCEVVDGARDDGHTSGTGLRGNTDKGARGNRLLVAHPEAAVTHAAVSFRDGRRVTADVVSVPGTAYRAYAIPIATGQTIAAVDEYDVHNRLLSHDTEQR